MKVVRITLLITALLTGLIACNTHKTVVRQDELNHLAVKDYGIFLPSDEGKEYVSYIDQQESYMLDTSPVLSFEHVKLLKLEKGIYGKELKIDFDKNGAAILEKVTSDHVGEKLAIVVNGKVIAAPTVMHAVSGGSVVITGLSDEEVKAIFRELKLESKLEQK